MRNLKERKRELLSINDFETSKLDIKEEASIVGGLPVTGTSSCFTSGSPLGCDGVSVCLNSCGGGATLVNLGGVTYLLHPVVLVDKAVTKVPNPRVRF